MLTRSRASTYRSMLPVVTGTVEEYGDLAIVNIYATVDCVSTV